MRLPRRRLLALAAVSLTVPLVDRAVRLVVDGVRGAAAAIRPGADGTSSTRCAMCGAAGHTMLDPRCPAARRVF